MTRERVALLALAGPALWVTLALGLDGYGGREPDEGPYDFIVVAGAGVMPDGSPSQALLARTRQAVDLWASGAAPMVAFTGGVGDWGDAESVVARDLAIAWGVPADAIVTEDRSTSTEENAIEIRAVLGDANVLIVTDRYHVFRCERVFARHFSHVTATGARSPFWVRTRGSFREVAAVAWYAVRRRL